MAATVEQITDGFWFEICILIILTFLLIAVFRKYLVKRHRLTLLLFFIFVCFYIAIWASWSLQTHSLIFSHIRISESKFTLYRELVLG